MAKGKGSGTGKDHFIATQANLDKKGKTNKKLKSNPQAMQHLTATGKELKEKAEAYAKEHFGTGYRTRRRKRLEAEARAKEEAWKKKQAEKKKQERDRKDIKDVMRGPKRNKNKKR